MPRVKPVKPNCSHIYIIHCDNLPFIKCGLSSDIKNRIASYNTSHWDVIVKRMYLIPDQLRLKEVEQ